MTICNIASPPSFFRFQKATYEKSNQENPVKDVSMKNVKKRNQKKQSTKRKVSVPKTNKCRLMILFRAIKTAIISETIQYSPVRF